MCPGTLTASARPELFCPVDPAGHHTGNRPAPPAIPPVAMWRGDAPADWAAVPSNNPGPAQMAQQQELIARLRESLTQLPPQEAQAFCLRYLNDMSYRQIAKALGIKINAAGVLLHRARAKLRESFELSTKEQK